ncbi:hypothetical protein DSO57_1026867 [Entomophthora muscae]|uniref:Uncharacterized protein n=1 Tax=Entomophthora muscae TaxID=34485 RepID=A0ACC2T260_9FUNG|nr:hypothetical protein DSO57_1026867 [Entomophthora muscae]
MSVPLVSPLPDRVQKEIGCMQRWTIVEEGLGSGLCTQVKCNFQGSHLNMIQPVVPLIDTVFIADNLIPGLKIWQVALKVSMDLPELSRLKVSGTGCTDAAPKTGNREQPFISDSDKVQPTEDPFCPQLMCTLRWIISVNLDSSEE